MKTSHHTFFLEMVKHGDKELAWQKANPGNKGGNSARKAADRLLRRHPEMAAEIEEAVATIRQQAYTEAYRLYTEQQRTPLLSMMQRREILARIAKCEIKVCRYVKDGDSYRMLFEDPRPRDMIRAIETDAKMEAACNRAHNFTDPVLSQFNIYIDGRPCDDPAAPVNTDLPPGIVMLPRKAKKMLQESTGETTENGNPPATLGTHNTSPHPGDLGVHSRGAQNTPQPNPPLGGDRGALPQEKNPPENGNPVRTGATLGTHNTSPHPGDLGVHSRGTQNTPQSNPPLGGDRGALPQEKTPENGNPVRTGATLGTHNTSPHPGDLGVHSRGAQNTPQSNPPLGGDRGALPQEKTPENGNPPATLGTHNTSPLPGDLGVDPVSPQSPLYPTYLNILEKRKLSEEDLLHASWYSQHKRAEAAAPPPHILTDEEIAEMDRALAEERSRTLGQPQYNTFGKMYFPEKDTRCTL